MKQQTTGETLCPLARAAAIIADRWTILILRELRMGNNRFDGIQAQTGMSPNLLTQRLKTMEDNGLIERRVYQERPRRHAYCTTDKAHELDGMMLTLRLWGMRHCGLDREAEGAVTMTHRRTGAVIGSDWQPEVEDLPFAFSQVETRVNPAWADERAARAESFATGRRIQVSKRTPQKEHVPAALKAERGERAPRKRESASLKD
ncbi:helix-turn-helix transcriptional regulator [Burkholderia aenigmatica]|uniref:winged helix-turn-helix transcriptional regulator n=1 Tax=Burkholderia cepacia complex TaxID=87882 RepID=UPI00158ACF47|nr:MULTISPECIES: helix-turn-helix domain-containing protein [Burkholderia cepacia complex]UKD16759.1 helix-turn-helix transcriptional regulator [Burkholderia aenigmatica]